MNSQSFEVYMMNQYHYEKTYYLFEHILGYFSNCLPVKTVNSGYVRPKFGSRFYVFLYILSGYLSALARCHIFQGLEAVRLIRVQCTYFGNENVCHISESI
ncbi:hypothetical protein RF11_09955 [Thelohanellus kitauei]|uniref:Uncharacterized protein n=1 Tax=Thelohanellus kitauei TaxID=669202 RepID=A0A0C2JI66_THEKT|nr:hypothetical protein RF11_09955 [Thelohanellus kitauei]